MYSGKLGGHPPVKHIAASVLLSDKVDRGRVLQSRRQPLCDTLSRYAFININVDIFFFAKFADLKRNIQRKLQVAFCNIAVGKDPLT